MSPSENPVECHAAALAHLENRRLEEALEWFTRAERCGYDSNICRAGRWTAWMLLGKFEEAWAESDIIAASGRPDPHSYWDGRPFTGKTVLIRCLHGFGDAIQFIRYAPLIRAAASRVLVQAPPQLVRLFRHVPGVDDVLPWGADLPPWESEVEVNELPRVFRATADTIPRDVPYIHIPPALRPRASGRQPLRAGLVWNSSYWNPLRCIPFRLLSDSLRPLGWELRSLQFGPERNFLEPMRPYEGDALDTALDMLSLDLVVSVDTMTAHLAGALALPVWLLLPFEADWRWMIGTGVSPWYPTMRLFRQQSPGDWPSALEQLRHAARAL